MQNGVSTIQGSGGAQQNRKTRQTGERTKVAPEQVDPQESFITGEPQVYTAEVLADQTQPARDQNELAVSQGVEAQQRMEQRVQAQFVPSTISTVEQAALKPDKGLTLAEIAKSATQAVGRTIHRLVVGDQLKTFRKDLSEINELEAKVQKELKTPEQFAQRTRDLRKKLENGATLDDIRNEAYAVAREAARQATGMRAYDCQVLGALAMNHGQIAEMKTGEGKTLTAVMPLYLNALAGKGAHLITVNETLAKRDSDWMGPIFKNLGMSVGCVLENQTPEQKREGYNCDVTYLTDRTLGFDFLRDRTAKDPADRVQRDLYFGLVDEVDEVMIDEARTPMILSVKGGEPSPDYKLFASVVKDLKPGQDFQVNEQQTSVWLTEGGLRYVENEVVLREAEEHLKTAPQGSRLQRELNQAINQSKILRTAIRRENEARFQFDKEDEKKPNILSRAIGRDGEYDSDKADGLETTWQAAKKLREQLGKGVPQVNLYSEENMERVHYLDACLSAQVLQVKGKHYSVEGGEVKIIDQNKGRTSQGKRFSNGLHQALEAKEGVEIRRESRTAASITLPELFNTYDRKSGMTGTGKSAEGEFHHFYGLPVVEVPTNKPIARKDHSDIVFRTADEKFNAVVQEAVTSAKEGRPVLIGTLSVNANKVVAARLLEAGWPADKLQVLNAETVRSSEDVHEVNAGRSGTVTLATGDRAETVMHDPVNYKKMAVLAEAALNKGQGVVMDADNKDDAEQLQGWLSGLADVSMVDKPQSGAPAGKVVIRVGARGETDKGAAHIDARDHAVEKPTILDVDPENMDGIVDKALKSYFEGVPVVLRAQSGHGLSASAERLLDAGLGLESMPMVCEGKEKENLLIELAGRSGFITVATNMAGRGANIKPDLVKVGQIAQDAYDAASGNKGVVVDLDKDSQATKIFRGLQAHIPVAVAESPDQKPAPGQVLIRSKQSLKEGESFAPAGKDQVQLKGDDYETGGLYVIGTERSSSRRIDDQLIGRAGRQGAVGDSRFFLSLQDDLLRLAQSHRLEDVEKAMGEGRSGVTSSQVSEAVDEVQNLAESQRIDARENSDKFDETMKLQRKTYFKFREQMVTGTDEDGERVDPKDYMADFAATGLADELKQRLGDKRKYSPEEIRQATARLGQELGLPLKLEPKKDVKRRDLVDELYPQVSELIETSPLPEKDWKVAFLYTADQGWQDQLIVMNELRDGVQLEAMAGKKPEEVYVHRGFEVFQGMVDQLKRKLGTHVLPLMVRRGQEQPPQRPAI